MNTDIKARIDSGAEITILSMHVYDELPVKPDKVRDVVMKMADKDTLLTGFITKPIQLQIGSQTFLERDMLHQ